MEFGRLWKHGLRQDTNADRRTQFCVLISLVQLTCIDAGRIVRQTLRHSGWQRCLHFDIQKSPMLISRQNVQNRQLVVVTVFHQERIQNFDMRNLWLIGQNRIEKMDRHTGMLRTPQHQLERKIHRRTDANCHVPATTDYSLPPSINHSTAGRSVTARDNNGMTPFKIHLPHLLTRRINGSPFRTGGFLQSQ